MILLAYFLKGKKVLKMNYASLRSEVFQKSLVKLVKNSDYKNISKLRKVAVLAKQLDNALLTSQKEWQEIASKYIQKDPETNLFKIGPQGATWIEGVVADDAEKAIADFMQKDVIIEAAKLTLADIDCVPLAPADLVILDQIITM